MSIQPQAECTTAAAIACLFSIAALATPALGQAAARKAANDPAKLVWLGCWNRMSDPEGDPQEFPEERQMICVAPGAEPNALEMSVIVDEEVVATETIVTDGSRQPIGGDECDGWIRSVPSEDRHRLYVQSKASCSDGISRDLTGASMMVPGNRWVDIHVVRLEGEREVVIQRYRPIGAGIARLPGALPSEMHALRLAASARLTVDNVIEALQIVDPAVVEAMLLESEASFGVDSDLLLRLADAGVPDEIVDLMVALSFPDYFVVEDGTIARQPEVYYGSYWSPWYPYYGYGFSYGYYYHHGKHSHSNKNRGGKVISGRGYVSVRPTEKSSGGLSGFLQGFSSGAGGSPISGDISVGSNSGNAGSASGSGYQSGNSAPKRPAIPK